MNTISSSYISPNSYETESKSMEVKNVPNQYMLSLFISKPSGIQSVNLTQVIEWTTNQPFCSMERLDLVTDITGTAPSSEPGISEHDNILQIDSSYPMHKEVFLRATSFISTVFVVDKFRVTVCGDQAIHRN